MCSAGSPESLGWGFPEPLWRDGNAFSCWQNVENSKHDYSLRMISQHKSAELFSNVEMFWEVPGYSHLLRRLSNFPRVILLEARV